MRNPILLTPVLQLIPEAEAVPESIDSYGTKCIAQNTRAGITRYLTSATIYSCTKNMTVLLISQGEKNALY